MRALGPEFIDITWYISLYRIPLVEAHTYKKECRRSHL